MNDDNSTTEPMGDGQRCPCCRLVMIPGSAGMEYTFGGFFFAGFSWLTLFFRQKGAKRRAVLSPSAKVGALFCKGCETLVIKGDLAMRRECKGCGLMVHPGRSDCQSCGEKFTKSQDMPSWVDY